MKRYIGTWSKESEDSPKVAELIIDGNQIEFYRRDYGEVFPCAFVGTDGEHKYKVFTNGGSFVNTNKTLELSTSYRTFFVLQQNDDFPEGLEITGIKDVSFIIPELIDWIDVETVEFGADEEQNLIAGERNLPSIILHDRNPHIEIQYESESFTKYHNVDTRTTFVLKNQPRIFITHENTVDVYRVREDINSLMQFWALLIGYVSSAEDIRLTIEGKSLKSWLYINKDFSYNSRSRSTIDKPRTTLEKSLQNIEKYFTEWYKFCYDDKYELIRRMFFSANSCKEIFAEDILVQYVKIIEGYHLRVSGDEEIALELRKAFKDVEKDIKRLIFSDKGKPLFTTTLEKVIPEWTFNSGHSADVAHWISVGYLGKKGLAERIKELDEKYFCIIAKNAIDILKLSRNDKTDPSSVSAKQLVELFYRKIVATRNYYSHYKSDKTDVLEFRQMNDTINVLKALILSILFSHMGMSEKEICEIISNDSELRFQTMFLSSTSVDTK